MLIILKNDLLKFILIENGGILLIRIEIFYVSNSLAKSMVLKNDSHLLK